MIEIKNLTIDTKSGKRIIDDLSFVINSKDKLAIIGEEGNGKSTLIKMLAKKTTNYAKIVSGSIKLLGTIGYLPQYLDCDLGQTVLNYFVTDELTGDLNYENLSYFELKIKEFGLPDEILDGQMILNNLSGGEKIKVQLIKMLEKNPNILLLDEPTNDLDLETIEFLENFIISFNGTVVFISHDEQLLKKCANCVLLIEQLRDKSFCRCTFKHVGFAEFMNLRKSLFEKQEQMAESEHKKRQKQLEFLKKVQQKLEVDMSQNVRNPSVGRLLVKKMKNVKSQQARFERTEITQFPEQENAITLIYAPMEKIPQNKCVLNLDLKELKVENKILARDIKLQVYGPKKVAIIGKNGCGKTTLLSYILKNLKNKFGLKVGYFSQDYLKSLNSQKSAIEELENNFAKVNPATSLACLNFTLEDMNKKINELSEGQKAKVLLMKILLSGANVLVLDEPTRNLSPLSKPVVTQLLKDFSGSIIFVSHDRNFVQSVATSVYKLSSNGLKEVQI